MEVIGHHRSMELFDDYFVDIALDPKRRTLHVNWKGHLTESSMRQGCVCMLDLMLQYGPNDVLNDNTHAEGIWSGASEWMAKNWFPLMTRAGLQRFAWVYSPKRFSQISTNFTLAMMDAEQHSVRLFQNRDAATAWLHGGS